MHIYLHFFLHFIHNINILWTNHSTQIVNQPFGAVNASIFNVKGFLFLFLDIYQYVTIEFYAKKRGKKATLNQ